MLAASALPRVPQVDLSVIIVNWNAKRYLLGCLEALSTDLATIRHEIIVVDNASTDGSIGVIQDLYPSVRLHCNTSNLGFATANNIGMRLSRGTFVGLVNSDVVVRPGCFPALLRYLERNPAVGLVGPRVLNGDYTLQRSCGRFPTLGRALLEALFLDRIVNYPFTESVRTVDYLAGSFMLFRRVALESAGLFDEAFYFYSEDVDLCRRFAREGSPIRLLPDAKVVHFGGASSACSPLRFYVQQVRARLQYWSKHECGETFRWYVLVLMLHQAIRACANAFLVGIGGRPDGVARGKMRRSIAAWQFLTAVLCSGSWDRVR
jgi:GT2 family glycosyltransferase